MLLEWRLVDPTYHAHGVQRDRRNRRGAVNDLPCLLLA
jgi:hypothetical protein